MTLAFRPATRADVPAVLDLLAEDWIGMAHTDLDGNAMFDALQGTELIVGEMDGEVIATYQISINHLISLSAPCRAILEGVRVASHLRGQKIGEQLVADAEERAKRAGATVMNLTSNSTREAAHRFYIRLGYKQSHAGFKKALTS